MYPCKHIWQTWSLQACTHPWRDGATIIKGALTQTDAVKHIKLSQQYAKQGAKSGRVNSWLAHIRSHSLSSTRVEWDLARTHTFKQKMKTDFDSYFIPRNARIYTTNEINTHTHDYNHKLFLRLCIFFMQISLCPPSAVPGRQEYYSLLNPTSHIWLGNICSPARKIALNTKGDNYIPLLGLARDEGPLYCSRPWPLYVPVYLQVGNNGKDIRCDVTQLSLNYPC